MERIPDVIHQSWHEHLQPLFDDPKMNLIRDKVLPNCKFYPKPEFIFRVFKMPLEEIKVVILGQDPYFNGTAIGYSFAVDSKTPIPKSLQIIRNEIVSSKTERDSQTNIDSDKWRELKHWRQQGIFLLNTALTVEVGSAGSHTGQWQWFTREIIRIISESNSRPVWLLWGAKAQGFIDYISYPWNGVRPKSEVDAGYTPSQDAIKEFNVYFKAPHPAAGSYNDNKITFEGCNHFNLCNKILRAKEKTIINW